MKLKYLQKAKNNFWEVEFIFKPLLKPAMNDKTQT